ncbi:MAG: zinc-dependent peptidase [Myxococcota bacterium]
MPHGWPSPSLSSCLLVVMCLGLMACGDESGTDDAGATVGSTGRETTGGVDGSGSEGPVPVTGDGTSVGTDDGASGGTDDGETGTTGGDSSSSETGTTVPPVCEPPVFPPPSVEDDGYRRFELCGWSVYMRIELFEAPLGSEVYEALAEDLLMVISVLPEPRVDFLRNTNFWMELDVPAFPGGVYHPSAQWLEDNGYPAKWAEGIQFGNANNFMTWVEQQPAVVLHELTHAWDHQHHGYAQPAVLDAYDQAMAAGLYDAVEYVDGQILEAYATTNAAEYFAELTEAYFWMNDFYPFVRADLAAHDPVGLAAVEQAWELP